MIKMTNLEMANALGALESSKETGKLAYAIARNTRKLRDACKEYMDIRTEALKKYGREKALGDGRSSFTFTKEDGTPDLEAQKAFTNEIKQYDDIAHDVDVYTVPEEVFLGGDLTNQQMEPLLWMIDNDSAEDKKESVPEIQNEE